jgi:hypothetical protein
MNRCTSNGTNICRSLNYYVGLFAASNNRATTTNKVKRTMNRVLGWSPWQWPIHWSLSHQQRGLDNHGIFFNDVVPWEIPIIKKKINHYISDFDLNCCTVLSTFYARKQKYLSKYGNWSTSCWLRKQQKYMYTYNNITLLTMDQIL